VRVRRRSHALNLYPVGRATQAAACKAAEAGAIPARDSISTGIGVDRHTSVFQTEIERALLSCPSTFPSESGLPAETPHGRSNGRVPDSVRLECAFRDANTGAGQDFTDLAAVVQLHLRVRVWVANFDSEVPALNRRELGAIPRQPTILPMWLSSDRCWRTATALPREAHWRHASALSIGSISHPW
jgi:hypothetical protein